MEQKTDVKNIPIREGLLSEPLDDLEKVSLLGSKCGTCGEVAFGVAASCQNCAGSDMKVIPLNKKGTLWTYTVIRSKPPGDYKGPSDPYVPLVEGLVELPDGIRVLSPLGVDIDQVKIGMDLKLNIYELYTNKEGQNVIAFRFDPI
jgi:uncharacterized OB-fold protein